MDGDKYYHAIPMFNSWGHPYEDGRALSISVSEHNEQVLTIYVPGKDEVRVRAEDLNWALHQVTGGRQGKKAPPYERDKAMSESFGKNYGLIEHLQAIDSKYMTSNEVIAKVNEMVDVVNEFKKQGEDNADS